MPKRPNRCPACGHEHVAAILYGEGAPDARAREEVRTKRAVHSHHPPTENDPRWHCWKCGFEWGHPRGLSGSSTGSDDLA